MIAAVDPPAGDLRPPLLRPLLVDLDPIPQELDLPLAVRLPVVGLAAFPQSHEMVVVVAGHPQSLARLDVAPSDLGRRVYQHLDSERVQCVGKVADQVASRTLAGRDSGELVVNRVARAVVPGALADRDEEVVGSDFLELLGQPLDVEGIYLPAPLFRALALVRASRRVGQVVEEDAPFAGEPRRAVHHCCFVRHRKLQLFAHTRFKREPVAIECLGPVRASQRHCPARPRVDHRAVLAAFARDLHVLHLAVVQLTRHQEGAPGANVDELRVPVPWPDGENTQQVTTRIRAARHVRHAEHFVDGVGHSRLVLDAVRVPQLETVGIGVAYVPLELLQDHLRVVANAHRGREEAVGPVAVNPTLHHRDGVVSDLEPLRVAVQAQRVAGVNVLDAERVVTPPVSAVLAVPKDRLALHLLRSPQAQVVEDMPPLLLPASVDVEFPTHVQRKIKRVADQPERQDRIHVLARPLMDGIIIVHVTAVPSSSLLRQGDLLRTALRGGTSRLKA